MRFRGLFFLLAAFATLGSVAMAADEQSPSEPKTAFSSPDAFGQPDQLNSEFFTHPNQTRAKAEAASPFLKRYDWVTGKPFPGGALADRDLCYTMRTYMVKPSEHLADNESGFRGYSSCQLASSYRLRSAEAPAKAGARLK